eukprot:scaffold124466_cov30-Attheya_sp.AAC.2
MSDTNPPDGDFIPVLQAHKPLPTEKAGKVTETRILAIETTQTTILKHFDKVDNETKSTNAKLDFLLNRLPPTLEDNLKAMTVNIQTVTTDLKTESANRDILKTFIVDELDRVRFDIQAKTEATEILIESKHQASLTLLSTPASSTTRASSIPVFPRFSASYGGIRSSVPSTLTPEKYYQDVVPADQDIHRSFIDPTTPMPLGLTGSSDTSGLPIRGLLSLVGNAQLNLSKFQEKLERLVLHDDSVTAVCDWYHGIRLALNTSGKMHIDVIPMFETLKRTDRFSTLLLPVDNHNSVDHTASSYNLCLNMYHSFGAILLAVFTTTTKMFPIDKCPKANNILLIHRDLRNGWDLLWNILRKLSPHLGGQNHNVHDLISELIIKNHESLPEFYNRALNLHNTIHYSQAAVPPTRLLGRFIDQLMKCPEIRLYLALKKAALEEHLQLLGENAAYPIESLQTIYDHLENVEAPMELVLSKSNANSVSNEMSSHGQPHIARFRNLPECDICFRRGHTADQCTIRGENFVPPDILCRAHQYNTKHGDKPIAPIRSWTSTAPLTARFDPNKKPYVKPPASNSQPYKPTIKYFLADSNGDPVQIDLVQITTGETDTSDPTEEEFHETQQEIPSPSIGIKPTINQLDTNIMPLFPDYPDMFDPMALQQLQEN